MPREIERKFRLTQPPPAEVLGRGLSIVQGYLLTGETELRVRRKGDVCYLTVKSEGALVRDEWETEIPASVFDSLWPEAARTAVEKVRHAVSCDGYTLEVDLYQGALTGLVILECELPTEEAARAFTLPKWAHAAVEVTADPRYKNKSLATSGLPA